MSWHIDTENIGTGRVSRFRRLFEDRVLSELVTIREKDKDKETTGDTVSESKREFRVTAVDLNIKSNVTAHHTNEFDITDRLVYDTTEQLVIRRGQPFDMKIQFSRTFDQAKDKVKVVFEFGINPLPSKGSRIELSLKTEDLPKNPWKTIVNSNENNWLSLTLTPPSDCAVAKWSLKVDILIEKEIERYKHEDPVYILFNPWCKDDQVYMDSELLKEYVLNEDGEIYVGSYRSISARKWLFGQFTGKNLECVMYLLDEKSRLWDNHRGDPIKVSRAVSSIVNSSDDNGVLTGKWADKEEDYKPFHLPWSWTGSVAILEEYFEKKRPVKYGQCWVFSGVVTTVCRALGIPARSVTNFASAHDTDGSVSIDTYFHKNGKEIKGLSRDSVWNFHVWNDVWMRRPDLKGDNYDGWQAIDATPQERSDNVFRMGPMSLKAIKQGDLHCQYDGPFAFSEVNADKLSWMADETGNMKVIYIDRDGVGKRISTKLPIGQKPTRLGYTPYRQDITDQYKYDEGSKREREAVRKAHMESTRKFYYEDPQDWKIKFSIDMRDDILIGEPIDVFLKIKSSDVEGRLISGSVTVSCTDYTGDTDNDVMYRQLSGENKFLQPNDENTMTINVPFKYYYPNLADGNFIRVSCMCEVESTGQIFTDIQTTTLKRPSLILKAPKTGAVNKKFTVDAYFDNPLDMKLTDCEVVVEGPGLQNPKTFPQSEVEAKSKFNFTCEFTPEKAGTKLILLLFNSKQLHSIEGSESIEVAKATTGVPMETE